MPKIEVIKCSHNFSAAEVNTTEALQNACSLGLSFLLFGSVDNVGQRRFNLLIMVSSVTNQTVQTFSGDVMFVAADGSPGRLLREVCEGEKGYGPEPLTGKRQPPSKISVNTCNSTYDTTRKQDSGSPTHAHIACNKRSEHGWDHF